jgi:predicted metal-binding protein
MHLAFLPVGTLHALPMLAAKAAAEETMNRKRKQFVSIWICISCEACNSASAELCLSCGNARPRREALGLRRDVLNGGHASSPR